MKTDIVWNAGRLMHVRVNVSVSRDHDHRYASLNAVGPFTPPVDTQHLLQVSMGKPSPQQRNAGSHLT